MKKLLTRAAAAISMSSILLSIAPVSAQSNRSTASVKTTSAVVATAPVPTPVTVVVQSGDYLEKIANDHNTTYLRLYYANGDIKNPDLIFPDEALRVPAETEQLTARELPTTAPVAVQNEVNANPSAGTAPVIRSTYTSVAVNYAAGDGGVWDRIAACESGGNWAINTENGFYGGLQFTIGSWAAAGGSGNPANASREEQISRGQVLQARQGWGAWPACSAKLGL